MDRSPRTANERVARNKKRRLKAAHEFDQLDAPSSMPIPAVVQQYIEYLIATRPLKSAKNDMPGKAGDPGRTAIDKRRSANAVLYMLHAGIPWADLPERFGKPNRLWKRYDRWAAAGVGERVARALGDAGLTETLEDLQPDSTSVKAHPTASTGRREPGK